MICEQNTATPVAVITLILILIVTVLRNGTSW
jgi:hypothetical protein